MTEQTPAPLQITVVGQAAGDQACADACCDSQPAAAGLDRERARNGTGWAPEVVARSLLRANSHG